MSSNDEFLEYCSKILKADFGPISGEIIKKAQSRKNLDSKSNLSDFEEFIEYIESSASAISGKHNAGNICKPIRAKAIELTMHDDAVETFTSLNKEASELNVKDLLARINAPDLSPPSVISPLPEKEITAEQKLPEGSMGNTIEEFLKENALPAESEVTKFATNLAAAYGDDPKKVRKTIIEQIKFRVVDSLCKKAIKEEINRLLTRYPEPKQTDIDDFVRYVQLLKLNFKEAEIRQEIERERLYRKFQEPQYIEITHELTQLIDIMKTYDDKGVSYGLQEQGLSYLVEDESGVSEKLLFELVELLMLIDRGSLQGPYLKRMSEKTHSGT